MEIPIKSISVLSSAFGATGDLISDVLIGSRGSQKQGLIKIDSFDAFPFRLTDGFSGRVPYVAPVKGIWTLDPNISGTVSELNVEISSNGYLPTYPNANRQDMRVLVGLNPGQTVDNEGFCDLVVAAFNGSKNQLFTAAKSGSGGSAVVTFTEKNFVKPRLKYVQQANLAIAGMLAGMTFSKTTATVDQQSYLGADLTSWFAELGFEITPTLTGDIVAAGAYSMYEIIYNERALSTPFNYKDNRPYKLLLFVYESATNFSVFNTKINAAFNLGPALFVDGSGQNTGDTITPTDPINVPANGTRIVFVTAPTGLIAGKPYYSITATGTTFQVANSVGGSAVAITADTSAVSWNASLFIPFEYKGGAQNTGDTITPTAAADLPAAGDEIIFNIPPTGLQAGIVYYAITITATTFQVAATRGGAALPVTADTTIVSWNKGWGGLNNADTATAVSGKVY